MAKPAIDLSTLTPSEKLELIDELWQSLSPEDFALTRKQRQELDRRLDRVDLEGPTGTPWLEVRETIQFTWGECRAGFARDSGAQRRRPERL